MKYCKGVTDSNLYYSLSNLLIERNFNQEKENNHIIMDWERVNSKRARRTFYKVTRHGDFHKPGLEIRSLLPETISP